MKRLLLLTLMAVALSSCDDRSGDPTVDTSSNRRGFAAYKEGTVDGCSVYYVMTTMGSNIHFVRCPNETTETQWATGGKTRTFYSVPTVN